MKDMKRCPNHKLVGFKKERNWRQEIQLSIPQKEA
jgi:hypothetical protein